MPTANVYILKGKSGPWDVELCSELERKTYTLYNTEKEDMISGHNIDPGW
jgi:hypothetical protein